jgi:hypothetical protein
VRRNTPSYANSQYGFERDDTRSLNIGQKKLNRIFYRMEGFHPLNVYRKRMTGGCNMTRMTRSHFLIGITAIALLLLLSSGALATTITVQGGSIPTVGDQKEFTVTGDSFPDGLLGYEFNVTLTEPLDAEIVSFQFPPWVNFLTSNSTVPTGSLLAKASGYYSVPPGSTNVPLINVTIKGDANGVTNLTIDHIILLEDYSGNEIPYTVVPGVITIGTTPTTTVTTTATTTVPTTEVTTTATTTVPTTEVTTTATTTVPTTEVTTTATTTVPTTEVTTTTTTTVPTTTTTSTTATTVPTTTVTTPLPPGSITVYTHPGGATVALDGNVIGVTQIIGKTIPAGTYELSISLAGYKTYKQSVTVLPGKETRVDNLIILQPGSGTVTPFPTVTSPTTATTSPTTIPTTLVTTTATTTIPTPSPSLSPSPTPTGENPSGIDAFLEYWKKVQENTSNTFSQLIQKFL